MTKVTREVLLTKIQEVAAIKGLTAQRSMEEIVDIFFFMLDQIIKENTDGDLGTVDYDGIVEDILILIKNKP